MLSSTWQLDRLAFHYLTLSQSGAGISNLAKDFFEIRNHLSPYAKAFLALTLENENPGDIRIDTLLADLETSAIQDENGVHWEGKNIPSNLDTHLFNTAVSVYALAKFDPASQYIPDALRYLMVHHEPNGSWGSTYETAWTILAFIEVMKGTGELSGGYTFSASVNDEQIIRGQAGMDTRLTPISASMPVNSLFADDGNGLMIERSTGPGRLYYSASLQLNRPAAETEAHNHGIFIVRSYEANDQRKTTSIGELVDVHLIITIKDAAHYLIVEDSIPAGAVILDTDLRNKYQSLVGCIGGTSECYSPQVPFSEGWGGWWFNSPSIHNNRVTWAADFIPAGTYELVYTLLLTRPGEYQVLPAKAWLAYDQEIFGSSTGDVFEINER
jgi:hypothetical protein